MKKLFTLVALIAGLASGQTYNVAITNSLLGPVDVTISEAIITGAVVNASVTNSFAPVNNVTSIVNVGSTTVNNTNIFDNVITNIINNNITNVIQNIVQSNNYFVTSGVSSISFTGAVDGAITFAGNAVTQTNKTFNFSFIDTGFTNIVSEGSGNVVTNLVAGTGRTITQQLGTVSASGGGLNHFQSSTGLTTQTGSFLFPTSNVPALTNVTFGLFIGTNSSISVNRPDGAASGGNARSPRSIDLQQSDDRNAASQVAGGTGRNTLIGTWRSTISGGSGNLILGNGISGGHTISAAGSQEANVIIGGTSCAISDGSNNGIYSSLGDVIDAGDWSTSFGANTIMAGAGQNRIDGRLVIGNSVIASFDAKLGDANSAAFGLYYNTVIGSQSVYLTNGPNNTVAIGSIASTVRSGLANVIAASSESRLNGTTNSAIIAGSLLHQGGNNSFISGVRATNTHAGNFIWRGFDGSTNYVVSAKTNTALFFTSGLGINTNNPQQALHVAGAIRADTAYHLGGNVGITVTQKFLDASSNIRTNIFIGGILVTGYTE